MPTTLPALARFPGTASCYHGGAFFDAIGPGFEDLERRHHIINADVLDAWFAPAPAVLEALTSDLDWLARTSPPTNCEGLIEAIARARGVPGECVLAGAGSSDLIFRAFARWLTPESRVLLLDPTYGEYAHVCEQVIGCRTERLTLERATNYRLDLDQLHARLQFGDFDLTILVNPNNPTGQYVPRDALEDVLRRVPADTLVWIDEAYLEYVEGAESLEQFASQMPNVVVCKSMSKAYALSGLRVAYLCGAAERIAPLRAWTPPWVVGLLAQLAGVRALQECDYYAARYRETAEVRRELVRALRQRCGEWEILESVANFVLCHLPTEGPTAATLVERCRRHGLFLRDVGNMGTQTGPRLLRIAVKDMATQARMMEVLEVVQSTRP